MLRASYVRPSRAALLGRAAQVRRRGREPGDAAGLAERLKMLNSSYAFGNGGLWNDGIMDASRVVAEV
jgi:hypothetical protein